MGKQVGANTYGGVAQLGEHLPCKQGVKSSNLSISTSPAVGDHGRVKNDRTLKTAYRTSNILKEYLDIRGDMGRKAHTTQKIKQPGFIPGALLKHDYFFK